MIDLEEVVVSLCEAADGKWESEPYRSAWERVQISARDEPAIALAAIAILAGCLSDRGLAKVASKPLRHIIEDASFEIARHIQRYRSEDQHFNQMIDAVERYSAKVGALRSALVGQHVDRRVRLGEAIRIVNPYPLADHADEDKVWTSSEPPARKDELLDFYDIAVSERPTFAWAITDAVAARADSDDDRLVVAQPLSRLLNLHEGLVESDLVERARQSQSLRAVLAHCRFAISEDLLDRLLLAFAPAQLRR